MRRFLKIVAIVAVFATALSYFVFRGMFFDPFEGTFTELDSAVPRDASFFVRRKDLELDFTTFPWPAFFDQLRLKKEWREFASTETAAKLAEETGIEARLKELESSLAELPLDPLADALGRECLVMGRLREDGTLALAVLCRASFKLKLVAEAVGISMLRGFAGDALEGYRAVGDAHELAVAGGRKVYLARRLDLLAVADDEKLMTDLLATADGGSETRFTDRPQVRSGLALEHDDGRPIDFALDVANLAKTGGWTRLSAGPDDPVWWQFLANSFGTEPFGLAAGRLFLGKELRARLRGGVDHGALKNQGAGLWSGSNARASDMFRHCGQLFPEDVFFAAYLRVKVAAVLRRMEAMLDDDTRSLFNDAIRNLRSQSLPVNTVAELIDTIGGALGDEVAIGLEPQAPYDIPRQENQEKEFIMPNDLWGPRVALMFPASDVARAQTIVDAVTQAIKKERGIARSWSWSFSEDIGVRPFTEFEFGDATIPPVAVGFIEFEQRTWLVVTTTGQFLREIVEMRTYRMRGRGKGLGEQLEFAQAAAALPEFAQMVAFCSSTQLCKALSDYVPVVAEQKSRPDWDTIRQSEERSEFDRQFPQLKGQRITPDYKSRIAARVDQRMEEHLQEWQTTELPKEIERLRKDLAYLGLMRWTLLVLGIYDEREIQLDWAFSGAAAFE